MEYRFKFIHISMRIYMHASRSLSEYAYVGDESREGAVRRVGDGGNVYDGICVT